MDSNQVWVVFAVLSSTTVVTSGFIFVGHCVFSAPCRCDGVSSVSCIYASLTDIPQLTARQSSDRVSQLRISLHHNRIHSIPAYAFLNVSSVNTDSISFNLYNNEISNIDDQAFAGAENKTTYLDLRNNQLTSLPTAFGKLINLFALYLEGNPLVSLDFQVLSHLSSLWIFGFDMGKFDAWPNLNMLHNLHTLVINYIPFSHLPLGAFSSFESGLTTLTLSYSKLVAIPPALCHLPSLTKLNFDNGVALESNFSLLGRCSRNLTKLATLSIQNNSLNTFPDVLQSLSFLDTLFMDNNPIRYIHTDAIPTNSHLRYLRMQNNSLTHIPFAVNKLKHVATLDLAGNKIITIEDNDLIGLVNLGVLDLNDNPIEYIAPNAFLKTERINSLNLDRTNLHLVPEAVRHLPYLETLHFDNDVDCSCKMSYLKGWNVTAVTMMYGRCDNDPPSLGDRGLKLFLLKQLPNCP